MSMNEEEGVAQCPWRQDHVIYSVSGDLLSTKVVLVLEAEEPSSHGIQRRMWHVPS